MTAEPPTKDRVDSRTWIKLAVEMGPLLLFFGTYILAPRLGVPDKDALFPATGVFMVAMLISLIVSWRLHGKIPPMLMVSAVLVTVMGGLTLILANKTFIFMKPTINNTLLGSTLLVGLMFGRPLLRPVFKAAFPPITDQGWKLLSRNWAFFFLFLAVFNEIMWRNFSEETWVFVKVWGVLPLTLLFMMTQFPVMNRHLIAQSTSEG